MGIQQLFTSLRNDFYIIFACDPGRKAIERESGGALIFELVKLLPYAKPITAIFDEAARRVNAPQRPWVHSRPGGLVPILGILEDDQAPMITDTNACKFSLPPAKRAQENYDEAMDVLSLVLVGETGVGKSTLGNSLAGGGIPFEVSDGFDSHTKSAQHADVMLECGQRCRIVDTVGFLDTCYSPEENFKKFVEFADRVPGGIDLFVFVFKKGRFTQHNVSLLKAFFDATGKNAHDHTIVAFSASTDWCDKEDFFSHCQMTAENNEHLRQMLTWVQNVFAVDNRSTKDTCAAKKRIWQAAIEIRDKNGGRQYSNDALAQARQRREFLRRIADELRGHRRDRLAIRMNEMYNGFALSDDVVQEAHAALLAQEEEDAQQGKKRTAEGSTTPRAAYDKMFDAFEAVGTHAAGRDDLGVLGQMFMGAWNAGHQTMRHKMVEEGILNSPSRTDSHSIPKSDFSDQLSQLQEMGFTDHAKNLAALQSCNGDIEIAVNELLTRE